MKFFFHHFYHTFAWTYDFVASWVSVGRWNDWIESVVPYIQGPNILEIGHGPGYLQSLLISKKVFSVGLDESPQMGHLARQRLKKNGETNIKLIRALAENLPFTSGVYDTVVSTFPTEYIFDPQTLTSIERVLRKNGRLIVLPAAWIVGQKFLDRGAAWLFKITGQAPAVAHEIIHARLKQIFDAAGLNSEFQILEIKSSIILMVIAGKSNRL
jgi:ubiquinone/menaquinone biosynthesis C-methylase UbiE